LPGSSPAYTLLSNSTNLSPIILQQVKHRIVIIIVIESPV
jgi:hypothetical protein